MAHHPLIPGYTTRAVRLEDAPAIADMLNREVRQWAGEGNISGAEYAHDIEGPDINPELDTAVVLDGAGRPAAAADVYTSAPFVRVHCFVRVAPEHLGRGIGTELTRWALARARERTAAASAGERITANASTRSNNEAAAALLIHEGFALVRTFFRMEIAMDGPPPAPVWPAGITVRTMTPGADERALYRAIEEAFRDHWGHVDAPEEKGFAEWHHYLTGSPSFDPETVFLAVTSEGEIAGAATCLAPEQADRPAHVWQLGVRRPWRRHGLGRALLLHAFGAFHHRGIARVALGVDADSPTGATRLYESAGMTVKFRNDVYELELRPAAAEAA